MVVIVNLVHGVGQSPVFQILLKTDALAGSAAMLSTSVDFPSSVP